MKILRPSNNPKKAAELLKVLRMLESGQEIPKEYNPHMLKGDYEGCMECHIQGDFLLIWIDIEADEIILVRLGSHSELYGKGVKR